MTDILTKQQILKIREVLKFASKESSFYKAKLKKFSLEDLRIKNYEDFKKIPFTTAEDLRQKNREFLTNSKYIWRIWSTTGTTGEPKLAFAGSDLISHYYKEEIKFMLDRAKILNPKKEIAAIFFPMSGLAGAGPCTARALEELGIPVIALGIEAEPSFAYLIMKKSPPTLIFMYPSSFLLFTNKLKEINPNFSKEFKIKAIFSTGEPLTINMRHYFETEWRSKCFDMTGGVDIANFTGGECQKHNGFHLFTDKFLFEIYNRETKETHLEGEGELVVTVFGNKAMPLIRYLPKDQVKIFYEKCGCGLLAPRMWFTRRTDDRIILAGAIKFYVTDHINRVLTQFQEVTSAYQVKISNYENKDLIELIVEANKKFVSDKELEEKISKAIINSSPDFMEGVYQDKMLAVPKVKIVEIGTLERFRGKVKDRIIDNRKRL